jgi:hypothetical protein
MTDLARWLAWCRRAGLTVLRDLPRSCLVHVAVREGSSWSARSRAAARTNELDADERRTIMDSEEGPFVLVIEEGRGCPRAWRAEWSRKHPFGVRPACGMAP